MATRGKDDLATQGKRHLVERSQLPISTLSYDKISTEEHRDSEATVTIKISKEVAEVVYHYLIGTKDPT